MLKFEEYLKQLHERSLSQMTKDFSFDNWLVESRATPEITAKVKAMSTAEAIEKSQLIMELVKQKLFTHFPMWRAFWSKMPPIASVGAGCVDEDGIGTMCTTGTAIFYDPKFVIQTYEMGKVNFAAQFKDGIVPNAGMAIREGLRHPMDYSLFVIIHEILHCSLMHHLRKPAWDSEYISPVEWNTLWNIAADYEINHLLLGDVKSELYEMPPLGVRADEKGGAFKVPKEDYEFFAKEAAETIFWRIIRNLEEKRAKKQEEPEVPEVPLDPEVPLEPLEPEVPEPQEQEGSDEGEGGEQEGEGGEQEGEGQPGGEGSGEGEGQDDSGLRVGDVIYNRVTGEYGVVSNVSGEMVDYDPISEDEARAKMK